MASFDSFTVDGDEIHSAPTTHPFDDDGSSFSNYGSYSNFPAAEGDVSVDHVASSPEIFGFDSSDPNSAFSQSPFGEPIHVENGNGANGFGAEPHHAFASDGPILPPPAEMEPEQGFALREWRCQNAIVLEEKERKEKELSNQIIEEAEVYKREFHERRKVNNETNKTNNREKEKLFLANQDKFHKNAPNHYWSAISELIPREVVNIEKRRGKKEQENKPSITVVQGPKPGKPTDLSRFRHIVVKLKHNPPAHMMPPPPAPAKDAKNGKDGKDGKNVKDAKNAKAVASNGTAPADKDATAAKEAAADGSSDAPTEEAPAAKEQVAEEPEPTPAA